MKVIDHDLELFLAMAKALNISRASDQLGIQQSGLSKALKRLEARLEQRLFIRKKSGLELTPFGASLKDAVGSLQDHWEHHLREKVSGDPGLQGLFRVGAHASIAISVIPRFLGTMLGDFPGLELELTFARSPEINRQVLNHELDLGFVMNPVMFPDLVVRPITREHVYYWHSKNFPATRVDGDARQVVLYNPEMLNLDRVLSRAKPARLIAVPSYEVLASTLQVTPCLGILPEIVARRYKDLAPQGRPFYPGQLCLVYRKDRFTSRARRALITQVIEALRIS